MSTDTLTIRSSVSGSLYKKTLFRGSFLALLGFIPLLFGSLKLDAAQLSVWGIPLFFLGAALIMFGMVPYKRLAELQKYPNEILFIENESIGYSHLGRKTLTIPLKAISSLQFQENPNLYGIKLYLKKPIEEKIIVHNPRFPMEKFEKASKKRYACDLFLPYFSRRSYEKLKYLLEPGHAS